jgi:hypothetical protein
MLDDVTGDSVKRIIDLAGKIDEQKLSKKI